MTGEVRVVFQPEGKRTQIKPGTTVLEAAKLAGADLNSICGGEGTCGKCKVIVKKGGTRAKLVTEVEKSLLSPVEISSGYRLACFVTIEEDVIIRIPEESRTGKQRLQVEGIETPVKLEPFIKKCFIKLPTPTLQDARSDTDRLMDELKKQCGLVKLKVNYHLLQNLPLVLREGGWEVTVTIWNNDEIIHAEPKDATGRIYGYAVDIGTTKLAGYLLDLGTGKVVAADSLMNPQIPYGEDVITRITYAMKGPKERKELQQTVVTGINEILKNLLEKTGVNPEMVLEMTAVGNTAMHHLFLDICPKYVALSPYASAVKKGMDVEAQEVGVRINPNGNIHVLPVIAGFVGADTVAVALATEIYKRDELCMVLDIGTNTEVLLGNKDGILTCSCASGPALEGAHIKQGMRAATGAIEKVKIDPQNLEVEYQTTDNSKPCGICGSAMVDIVGEMLKAGIIDLGGTFNKDNVSPRIRKEGGVLEFVLAWRDETSTGQDIALTQKDVREIQLAKAAMHTGCMTLMKKTNTVEKDIDVFLIAGAFGSHTRPESARLIGMFPEVALNKIKVVGNAAGTGARMALVSKTAREIAEDISEKVKYVELATEPKFQSEFFNSCFLPYTDLARYPETSELLRSLGRYPTKLPKILN